MDGELVSSAIEDYCIKQMKSESQIFKDLAEETHRSVESPQMQVGHLEGAFLRLLVRMTQAKRILEIGTFTGYSTLSMAEGLPDDGVLITCDIDPKATSMAQKYWAKSPHGKKISLKLAPAIETIARLDGLFDLAFIDADKENYIQYWDAIVPKIRSGGIIIADNVLWSGKVLSPKDPSDHAIVAFNRHVSQDRRIEQVMLTVRDGITIAYKF